MCQRITCSACGRPSFAGCGRHVEAVLGDVPTEARCHCHQKRQDGAAKGDKKSGLFSALFGSGARRPQ